MTGVLTPRVRILFLPLVDRDSTNAQSLNTREIAVRLDPERFQVTLLYQREPDPRLLQCSHIRLRRLPRRARTAAILREMLFGYDLIAYLDFSPASYLLVHLPRILRGRTKTVVHVEGTGVRLENQPRMLSFLFRGIVPNCDECTAITDRVAHEFRTHMRRTVRGVLPIGVDTDLFQPGAQPNQGPLTVLFAGTVMESKRPMYILEAAAHLAEARFRILGPDRYGYSRVMARRISELGLCNVTIEGPKSQSELAQAMRESDVFLLPSAQEGLPKVTLEAAASALPCIVFRDYETPSVLDGVTGFQVATFEELMGKLQLLARDRDLRLRMGAAAREHALQYSWDVIAQRWQDAYLSIVAEAPRCGKK